MLVDWDAWTESNTAFRTLQANLARPRPALSAGGVQLFPGDCRESLRQLADNSIDSVVTDPPYALVSIVKRFGSPDAAPARSEGATGIYTRASAGFMGKQWDTGETAFSVEFWSEVMRVLKPGGHVVAFGASRGYHRLACAIEDAGFEVRDSLMWIYGTGFPKSHDVSKGIDKANGREFEDRYELGRHIKERREALGISRATLNAEFDSVAICNHWEAQDRNNASVPTPEHWARLKIRIGCDSRFDELVDRVGAEREVIGVNKGAMSGWNTDGTTKFVDRDITAPATPEAAEWEGWGTALKPAFEPIILARRPLSEPSVAANVLRWRTGALNIDATRVSFAGAEDTRRNARGGENGLTGSSTFKIRERRAEDQEIRSGRWPANVVHDGSDEVVGAFPAQAGSQAPVRKRNGDKTRNTCGAFSGNIDEEGSTFRGDSGSAARFFYSAKASKADRAGSKHPTVKPIALMQWLCRLVTPPGGTVLDPFAGSGTTGAAALAEGFNAVLCEREAEYLEDIRRRLDC